MSNDFVVTPFVLSIYVTNYMSLDPTCKPRCYLQYYVETFLRLKYFSANTYLIGLML